MESTLEDINSEKARAVNNKSELQDVNSIEDQMLDETHERATSRELCHMVVAEPFPISFTMDALAETTAEKFKAGIVSDLEKSIPNEKTSVEAEKLPWDGEFALILKQPSKDCTNYRALLGFSDKDVAGFLIHLLARHFRILCTRHGPRYVVYLEKMHCLLSFSNNEHTISINFPFDPGAPLLLATLSGYNDSFANEIDGLGIIDVFLMETKVGNTNFPIECLAPSCFGLHLTTYAFTLVQATEKDVFDTLQPKFCGALLFCHMSVNISKNKYEVFSRLMIHVAPSGSTLVNCVWDPGISMRHITNPWLSVPKYYVMAGYKNCSLFASEVAIGAIFLTEFKGDIALELVLVEHLRSHPTIACGPPLSIGFVLDCCYNAFKGPSIMREELIITLLQIPHVQFRSEFLFYPGTSLLNLAHGISLVNGVPPYRKGPGALNSHVSDIDLRIGPKSLPARVDFYGPCFHKHIQNLVYLCKCRDLLAVVEYWELVNTFHDHPKTIFANCVVDSLFHFAQQHSEFCLGISLVRTGRKVVKDSMEVFCVPIRVNHDLTKLMPSWRFADGTLALVFSFDLLLSTKSIHDQGFNWLIISAVSTLKGQSILFFALIVFTKIIVKDKIFSETRGAPSRIGFTNNHTLDRYRLQVLKVLKNIAGGMVVTGPGTICLCVVHDTNIKGAYQIIGVDMMQSIYETTRHFGVMDFLNLNATTRSMPRVIRYIFTCITYGGAGYSFECIGDTRLFTPALQFGCDGWNFTVTLGVQKLKSRVACFLRALFSWDLFCNCVSNSYFVDMVPDPYTQVTAMTYELRYLNLEDKVLIENGGIVMNLLMGLEKQDSCIFINGLRLGISLGLSPNIRQPNKSFMKDYENSYAKCKV